MPTDTPLDVHIESILFHKSEPLKILDLSSMLSKDIKEIEEGLRVLKDKLCNRGVVLIIKDGRVMLGTSPKSAYLIEELIKSEIDKDLGKAGIETLSIVLYKGPIHRSDIDYIRGVNSSFILRNLLIRGLVERITQNKKFYYRPTFELLSYLGITDVKELPDYDTILNKIDESINEEKDFKKENNE